jgi:hypothetical protein
MLQLIISFLGGGILVALINWARTSRSERAARKHDFTKEQITKVYGPLFFFVGITEALFALNDKFHKAYNEHFVDQEWGTDSHTRENLRKETDATLQIANHYITIVRDNNSKIMDILRENYAYIDPEDTEVFQQFIVDHLRMEREFKTEQPLETPLEIYLKVGEISYSRKEFIELVKKRFTEKNGAIRALSEDKG